MEGEWLTVPDMQNLKYSEPLDFNQDQSHDNYLEAIQTHHDVFVIEILPVHVSLHLPRKTDRSLVLYNCVCSLSVMTCFQFLGYNPPQTKAKNQRSDAILSSPTSSPKAQFCCIQWLSVCSVSTFNPLIQSPLFVPLQDVQVW